jgi:hypothetical protein
MALKFDPTINLGHVLTFGAMLVSVSVAFSLLDRRISVLEERSNSAVISATERQIEQKDSLREIKSDIKDLQRSVNEIGRAVAGRPALGRIP